MSKLNAIQSIKRAHHLTSPNKQSKEQKGKMNNSKEVY